MAVAGVTDLGRQAKSGETEDLRRRRIVQTAEDMGINMTEANTSLLSPIYGRSRGVVWWPL